jgi:hypothetical protein
MRSVQVFPSSSQPSSQQGSSLLELLGVLLVILSLVIGVVGVGDYLLLNYRTGRAVDRMVYDQSIKPLSFDSQGEVSLNQNRLRDEITSLVARLEGELTTELDLGEPYRIEVQIAELQIDDKDGKLQALSEPSSLFVSRGTMEVPLELSEKASLTGQFHSVAGEIGSIYPFALPAPSGASLTQEGTFLSRSALLGIRVFASLDKSATAGILERLGVENAAVLYEVRAVPLRGEIL